MVICMFVCILWDCAIMSKSRDGDVDVLNLKSIILCTITTNQIIVLFQKFEAPPSKTKIFLVENVGIPYSVTAMSIDIS